MTTSTRTTVLLFILAVFFLAAGCGTGASNSGFDIIDDVAASDASEDTGDISRDDKGINDGNTSKPDNGHTSDPGGHDDPDPCDPYGCFEYLTCFPEFQCQDSFSYMTYEYVSCDQWQNPCCCDDCITGGPHTCPDSGFCVENRNGGLDTNPCRVPDCGGPDDPECPEGYFCEKPAGQCDGRGICSQKACDPEIRMDLPGYTSVCGCDGKSYMESCARRLAGTSIDKRDFCCMPEKIGFPYENPDAFTKWMACADPTLSLNTAPYDVPEDLAKMLIDALNFKAGYLVGCAAGEQVFIDTLTEIPFKKYKDTWDKLCRLASSTKITKIQGYLENACDGVECLGPVQCRPFKCESPCGCCQCSDGEKRCPGGEDEEGHSLINTCSEGCWKVYAGCRIGTACVETETSAECL